jgi:hypothetical protein
MRGWGDAVADFDDGDGYCRGEGRAPLQWMAVEDEWWSSIEGEHVDEAEVSWGVEDT